jgi:hypothetical protein
MAGRLPLGAFQRLTADMTGKAFFRLCHLSHYPFYNEQVLQLSVEQLLQLLPPLKSGEPSEQRQNAESTRPALPPHLGQVTPSPAWLMGLSSSNFCSQSEQTYSYIGIFLLPVAKPPPPP